MSDTRWAARYTFCDSLWRGRARVVADPELEALLRESARLSTELDRPVLELLDALLPAERGVPVWMIVASEDVARMLAPSRPGVRFVPASAATDVFARHPWEVALVSLRSSADELLTDVGGAASTVIDDGPAGAFGRPAAAWLSAIADAVALGRAAVLTAAAEDDAYEALVEVATGYFAGARIYAMYRPSMLAFVELDDGVDALANGSGELDGDELGAGGDDEPAGGEARAFDRWDVDDEGEADDDEDAVPLSFDNTLGVAEPHFLGYLALASGDELPGGLTLVEVASGGDEGPDAGLRHQLAQARRQADLLAIERQRLVEHIDIVEADNSALREAVAQLRDQLASSLEPAGGERLDEALAREQSLRWRVAALERELEELRVRPVGELEAELAAVRARLAAAVARPDGRAVRARADEPAITPSSAPAATQAPAGDPTDGDSAGHDRSAGELPDNGVRRVGTDDARRLPAVRAAASGRTAVLRAVEGLVRRVDRGAIGTIDLRRELTALRRRLRG